MTTHERINIFREWSPFGSDETEDLIDQLIAMNFFEAPASTKYHGAYDGGLFDHSFNVFQNLMHLDSAMGLKWQGKHPHESMFIVGMFHDLCKCDSYEKQHDGTYKYRTDTMLTGHGEKSVMLLHGLVAVTEEEIACIRYHMGAFTDKEAWSSYTNAIHKYPNVLWTHTADMMAAHIDEIEKDG